MSKLIGTKANQLPTNADLGSLAYQDSEAASIKSAVIKELVNTPDYTGKRSPNANPTIVADFANGNLPGYLPFPRSSESAFLSKNGIIEWSPPYQFDCDHDPETLEPLGLKLELNATNYFYNHVFGPSSGSTPEFRSAFTQGATFTANTTETRAPDGSNSAAKLVSTNGVTNSRMYSNANPIYNVTNCFSFFAKKTEESASKFIAVDCDNVNIQVVFNLDSGELHYVDGDGIGTSTLINWGMEPYPNGWYRCHATLNNAAGTGGTTSNDWRIYLCTTTANPSGPFTGNEATYLWGVQLENSPMPTSLIRTYGQQKTRNSQSLLSSTFRLAERDSFDSKQLPRPSMGMSYVFEATENWKRDGGTNYYYWAMNNNAGNGQYIGVRMGGSSGRVAHQIYTGTYYVTHEIGQVPDVNADYQVRSFTAAGSIGPQYGFQAATRFHKSKQFIGGSGSGDYGEINTVYGNPNMSSNQGSLNYMPYTDYAVSIPNILPGDSGYSLDDLFLGSSDSAQPSRNGWLKRIYFYPIEVDKETLIEMCEK